MYSLNFHNEFNIQYFFSILSLSLMQCDTSLQISKRLLYKIEKIFLWVKTLSYWLFSKDGYKNEHIFPCIFYYVVDINIIWTLEELQKTINFLKIFFEMKGKTKSLLNEDLDNKVLYTKKLIKAKVINIFICTNLIYSLSQWF